VPLNRSFNADAGSFVTEDEDVVLIIEPARVEEAVRDLVRIGLDRVVGFLDVARFGELAAAGARLDRTEEIPAASTDAFRAGRTPFVLDVRRATEFAAGHLEGAVNVAHTRLLARLSEVPRDREILVHCQGGVRSARAVALLARHGRRVINMAGGYAAYTASTPNLRA